jgi:hypothetical protein
VVVVEQVVGRIVSGPCRTPGGASLGAIGRREGSKDLRRRRDGDRFTPPLLRTRVRFPRASGIEGLIPRLPDRLHRRRGWADSTRKSDKPNDLAKPVAGCAGGEARVLLTKRCILGILQLSS